MRKQAGEMPTGKEDVFIYLHIIKSNNELLDKKPFEIMCQPFNKNEYGIISVVSLQCSLQRHSKE